MNFKLSDTVYLAKKDKGYTYINKSLCKGMPSDASDIMGLKLLNEYYKIFYKIRLFI